VVHHYYFLGNVLQWSECLPIILSITISYRSAVKMRALRRSIRIKKNTRGNSKAAIKEGQDLGVNLQFDNPWHTQKADEWVFGPDAIEDNVYRCLPQVNLHGMDEGLTEKLNYGILLYAIAEVGN
jgi:hypothetical protein